MIVKIVFHDWCIGYNKVKIVYQNVSSIAQFHLHATHQKQARNTKHFIVICTSPIDYDINVGFVIALVQIDFYCISGESKSQRRRNIDKIPTLFRKLEHFAKLLLSSNKRFRKIFVLIFFRVVTFLHLLLFFFVKLQIFFLCIPPYCF